MTRRCSRCGGRVPAGVSFFCHRCGARLEGEEAAEYPVCPRCGRSQPDRNSHFCDRCGVQLVPPARPVSPDSRIQPVTTCPACGHPNPGDSIRYCKKCGSPLRGEMPHGQSHHGRSGDSGPDNAVRATVAHREIGRKKMPVQPEGLLSLLRRRISWKAAAGMAVIILVLSAVFFYHDRRIRKPNVYRSEFFTGYRHNPASVLCGYFRYRQGEFICWQPYRCVVCRGIADSGTDNGSCTGFQQGGSGCY
ncbi:MAG: Double zinc ribbon [Methanoregula sp. PtaU1.Bin006]|uniref:double zinc ribbon domain-containing protein n=1 Tax=Methanoregula sp. PtaU1.Bin006 TaxID=1811681 RepID=UPI0009D5E62B|nr:MAG: Double zinc ribbon [Methanoregula sp. PtaU1.Bin006]